LAEIAYAAYSSSYGTEQSLERMAERGGFGWVEFGYLMEGNPTQLSSGTEDFHSYGNKRARDALAKAWARRRAELGDEEPT
jgi:hypothetical protein